MHTFSFLVLFFVFILQCAYADFLNVPHLLSCFFLLPISFVSLCFLSHCYIYSTGPGIYYNQSCHFNIGKGIEGGGGVGSGG